MRAARHRGAEAGSRQTSSPGDSPKGRTRYRRLPAVHDRNCLGTTGEVVVNASSAYLAAMTDPSPPIDDTLAELVESFGLLGDWEGRIGYVIDLGKDLEPLPDAERIEAAPIPTVRCPRVISPCCYCCTPGGRRSRFWPSTPGRRWTALVCRRP